MNENVGEGNSHDIMRVNKLVCIFLFDIIIIRTQRYPGPWKSRNGCTQVCVSLKISHSMYILNNIIFNSFLQMHRSIQVWYNEQEMPFHVLHEIHCQTRIDLQFVFHTMGQNFTVINPNPIQIVILQFKMNWNADCKVCSREM